MNYLTDSGRKLYNASEIVRQAAAAHGITAVDYLCQAGIAEITFGPEGRYIAVFGDCESYPTGPDGKPDYGRGTVETAIDFFRTADYANWDTDNPIDSKANMPFREDSATAQDIADFILAAIDAVRGRLA